MTDLTPVDRAPTTRDTYLRGRATSNPQAHQPSVTNP